MALKIRIIPVILVHDWCMVKTVKFGDMRNYGSPVVAARTYDAQNADEIMLLDIRATAEGREPDYQMVKDVVGECFCPVAVGGGIGKLEHIERLLKVGADKVVLNSALLNHSNFLHRSVNEFGSQCIVACADTLITRKVHRYQSMGAGEFFINDSVRDGTERGYDIELLGQVVEEAEIPVIVCGGAGQPDDMVRAVEVGASACAAGSMFLYTRYSPMAVREYMYDKGVDVRPYKNSFYGGEIL
jgi:cyclase